MIVDKTFAIGLDKNYNDTGMRLEILKCDYCGRFIGWDEFDDGTARRKLIQPDNEFGGEEYETYHVACFEGSFRTCIYPNWDGTYSLDYHHLDKDGYCNICGKKFRP